MKLILVNNSSDDFSFVSGAVVAYGTANTEVDPRYWKDLYNDETFIANIRNNNLLLNDGDKNYSHPDSEDFFKELITTSTDLSLDGVTVTGSADAQDGIVFLTKTVGYGTVFVSTSITGDGGITVTGVFEASPDGNTWFQVPQQLISGLTSPRDATSSIYFKLDGSTQDPQTFKVRVSGKFLRLRLDYYTGSGTTINATAYLLPIDNQDTYGLTKALITDFLGNSPTVGPESVTASLATVTGAEQRYSTTTDTYTSPGNGTTLGGTIANDQTVPFYFPMKTFSIQVVPTGVVTSWDVRLEGSLDGVKFDTILTHTNSSPGADKLVVSGATLAPVLYFRSRCEALVLDEGTDIVVSILGVP